MQTEQKPPESSSPSYADVPSSAQPGSSSRIAAGMRFALGSVFGLVFLGLFIFVYVVATRGPDTIGMGAANGKPFGPLDASGQAMAMKMVGTRPLKGQPAPNFALLDATGKYTRLSDLRGKTILLNFWATWCQPCQQEAPDIQKVYTAHKAENFIVIGVNYKETVDDVKRFFKTYSLTYPVVMDTDGSVAGFYGASAFPETYFIDRQGIVRTSVVFGAMSASQIEQALQDTWAAGGK